MRLLEGDFFFTKGQISDEFWDVETDMKFEVQCLMKLIQFLTHLSH